ncbi:MAG: M48 family metalloprotease [Cytophagales bacterium]|uniref:M48 family metalloprotease n=1 Tax=Cyclobacterium marinum TaxID=104 RepID=UPI0030DAC032|nr:M48 family metalloprotease [Cytophagales bacterium]|tara:strand:+ start:4874 stop:6970 length:2097 start_codon:yes stop_codon:yes gene_type:complete
MKNKKTAIKVSQEYKSQTAKAIASIALFLLTYILMLALAIILTILCVYGGILLIAFWPNFVTIVLGIGLASLGILVLFFLVKFVFQTHKADRSNLTEITQREEPELFVLIEEIVQEIGTSFPKKVYLSVDVNASVFYDSNFWSMFLPIKKNLLIGLGLVNTISKSELKAILSHEFGHFSQKSMKVGSYVYHVNQIIFNLLNDNEKYDRIIQKWANVSSYFWIFVFISVKIIEGIKWVLRLMFGVVNKSYLGLSREMEFHADEVAATVTGYEPLKYSLLRMSLADHSYNSILSFYENKINENIKSENIFIEQIFAMNYLAKENNIEIQNNLPQVSEHELSKFNKSKLVINDQWASHPSVEDRIDMLEKTGLLAKNIDNELANSLFCDIEGTQRELTEKLFQGVIYQGAVIKISFESFKLEFKKEFLETTFSKVYNGYYDNKNPLIFDLQEVRDEVDTIKLADLFSEENLDMVYSAIALQNDIETVSQISDKTIKLKTFDYDGLKYKQKDSKALLKQLEIELGRLNEQIKFNDLKIFQFFNSYEKERKPNTNLQGLYKQFFDYDKEFDSKFQLYVKLSNGLDFINLTTPVDQIRWNFSDIEDTEKKLKKEILKLMGDSNFQPEINKAIRDNFELYLSKDWKYFGGDTYKENNLEILFAAMNDYAHLLNRGYFLLKKNLLDYQITLINPQIPSEMISSSDG